MNAAQRREKGAGRLGVAVLMAALAGAPAIAAAKAVPREADRDSSPAGEVSEPCSRSPAWLGVPHGLTFDAMAPSERDGAFFFVRFADARPGEARVTLRDEAGSDVTVLFAELERGSALLLWDGRTKDGSRAPAGTYTAHLVAGGREASTSLQLDGSSSNHPE